MTERLKISELKTDGEGDKPAAGKHTKAKKRKRVAEYDDDSEAEEKPRKVTATSKVSTSKSKSSGSASQQKTESKSKPAPTKVSPTPVVSQSKQKKASPDSRAPVEKVSQAPVQATASPPTPAPPATSTRPSPPFGQVHSLQSNTAILAHPARSSPVPIRTDAQVSPVTWSYSSRKEAIRTNTGSQVQSPVTPHTEHNAVGSVSNLDVNGSAAMRDPRRAAPSPAAVAVLPQQGLHPLYSLGQQFQINPSDVEALLRARMDLWAYQSMVLDRACNLFCPSSILSEALKLRCTCLAHHGMGYQTGLTLLRIILSHLGRHRLHHRLDRSKMSDDVVNMNDGTTREAVGLTRKTIDGMIPGGIRVGGTVIEEEMAAGVKGGEVAEAIGSKWLNSNDHGSRRQQGR
ncbi:uncharacterized protein F5147DRAFT_658685 [Suillus discolor]|uniref:Uncharacterized protein n=1 Tax=Suillus discolor TaxID=1912936 RepID=A0A9P7JLV3_9AGAM|nr:uncharacterized protein F5147DRAFT_658685 [Suillus discolor]KAG2088567.1 hypothetical protein F5147DRAFT_658685 [Suillus discolor]